MSHRSKIARHTEDSLVLLIPVGDRFSEYEIEHDRMNTPEKVLGWIVHLAEKNWVTVEHIDCLIASAQRIGVEIDRSA